MRAPANIGSTPSVRFAPSSISDSDVQTQQNSTISHGNWTYDPGSGLFSSFLCRTSNDVGNSPSSR